MAEPEDSPEEQTLPLRELTTICLLAAVAGALIGFVGGAFRWCLERADDLRLHLLDWSHALPGPDWLVPAGVTAVCAAVAAVVVRHVPLVSGSGIQHVEAVARKQADPPRFVIVPATFVGGILAIGSGLVLGREGPIVHMGAAVGAETGRRARMGIEDIRLLQSSVAGAGLAVAFGAPLGGALFVLEEVTHTLRLRIVVPALLAVATGVGCSRLIVGDLPDFAVGDLHSPSLALLPVFVVFGLLTGLLGAAYNRMIMSSLQVVGAIRSLTPIAKAAVIGGVLGLAGSVAPWIAGGGDDLVERAVTGGAFALPVVAGYFLVRFVAGPVSYAAGTPGGLFAPMLALGALWGVLYAEICAAVVPGVDSSLAVPMALVGMAALFGASVRAPLTGIVLVMEMTAVTSVAVPMLAATACSVVVAQRLGSRPIYDSLRIRMLGSSVSGPRPEET
ncbi:ClC family H(+)/Cl(-) exchange transporter [Rhodococcus sp. CH91]|uniref:ClC family H(+)/Cl(-) exchange transporter n=1 Tax=Rhodococcus sp. CH91 TaxID=2910256 RepID=UPI001F4A0F18|nr:ClC family H(+)/Cl(-) exchange transporter [Rhodococcus sp. CH91]